MRGQDEEDHDPTRRKSRCGAQASNLLPIRLQDDLSGPYESYEFTVVDQEIFRGVIGSDVLTESVEIWVLENFVPD